MRPKVTKLYAIGDVVFLKSGGPPMTVVKNQNSKQGIPYAVVEWFEERQLRHGLFPEPALAAGRGDGWRGYDRRKRIVAAAGVPAGSSEINGSAAKL